MSTTRTLPPLHPASDVDIGQDEQPKRRPRKRQKDVVGSGSVNSLGRTRTLSRDRADSDVSGNEGNSSTNTHSVNTGNRQKRRPRKAGTLNKTDSRTFDSDGENLRTRDTDDYESDHAVRQNQNKKKKRKVITESKEVLVESTINGDVPTNAESGQKKNKKIRRKKRIQKNISDEEPEDFGLPPEFDDLQEDVVVASEPVNIADQTRWVEPTMKSEPNNFVYIEQKRGFKSVDKTKLERQRAEEMMRAYEEQPRMTTQTTLQFGLSTHKVYKTFTLFLQGLFAGFALWQITGSWLLTNYGSEVFLTYYNEVALAVQSMYYFLFAVSAVSCFDRYDMARPDSRCILKAVTIQSGAIATIFYVIGLIFSLSIAYLDDKIGLYDKNPELWDIEGHETDLHSDINTWRILNLIRGIFAILGWLIISLRPGTDRLTKNLQRSDENIMVQDQQIEVVQSSGV